MARWRPTTKPDPRRERAIEEFDHQVAKITSNLGQQWTLTKTIVEQNDAFPGHNSFVYSYAYRITDRTLTRDDVVIFTRRCRIADHRGRRADCFMFLTRFGEAIISPTYIVPVQDRVSPC